MGLLRVSWLPGGVVAAALFWCAGAASVAFAETASDDPGEMDVSLLNTGGVLVLHVEGPYELGSYRMCGSLSLESIDQAVTRLPGDGKPYLVGCYAAFSPDVPVQLRVTTFGIRYTSNVRVISQGPCNAGALVIPGMEWPASGGGIAIPFLEDQLRTGTLNTVHWFAVMSNGPGFLEVTPHPVYLHAGTFAMDMPMVEEPITGYGRIGFEQDGFTPSPGERHVRGVCCTPDGCFVVSELECNHFESVYLGPEATCESRPCGEHALRGGCCLADGCEMHTWMNCVLLGGHFLGEGVSCDSLPCPDPENRQ